MTWHCSRRDSMDFFFEPMCVLSQLAAANLHHVMVFKTSEERERIEDAERIRLRKWIELYKLGKNMLASSNS